MSGRFRFRPAFARLAAFAVALSLWPAGEAAAGPTVKKSLWVTWTTLVGGQEAFGQIVVQPAQATLKRPTCLPGEQPLLMRLRVTPGTISRDDGRWTGPEALGTWRTNVIGYAPDGSREFLSGHAQGPDAVDLTTEAGLPWTIGSIYLSAHVARGLNPEVGSAQFQLEMTLTCGRTDVALEPMR